MIKKIAIIICVLTLVSCGKTVLNAQLGDAVKVSVKDKIEYNEEEVTVELISITEDSRCPQGANCTWEGQVVVELLVGNVNILVNTQAPIDTLGYTFAILSVDPVKTDAEIAQEDYVIELQMDE